MPTWPQNAENPISEDVLLETAIGGSYLKPPSLKSSICPRGGGGVGRMWKVEKKYSQPKVCLNPIFSGQECNGTINCYIYSYFQKMPETETFSIFLLLEDF